jgi:hypothetical protein
MEVRDFFARIARRAHLSELEHLRATYRYEIRGAGTWRVIVRDGDVSVEEGDGPCDCTLAADEVDFIDVVSGLRNAITCLMQGRLTFRGSRELLIGHRHLLRAGREEPRAAARETPREPLPIEEHR